MKICVFRGDPTDISVEKGHRSCVAVPAPNLLIHRAEPFPSHQHCPRCFRHFTNDNRKKKSVVFRQSYGPCDPEYDAFSCQRIHQCWRAVLVCLILINICLEYRDPVGTLVHNEDTESWCCDLSKVSAKGKTLSCPLNKASRVVWTRTHYQFLNRSRHAG